jgi:hypothetical protein
MRTVFALIIFVLSAGAGYTAFGLYRYLKSLPPDDPTLPTGQLLMIGSVGFSPFAVVIALSVFAVLAGLGGIALLVAGHDNARKS